MNYSEVMELLTDEILELYKIKNSDYGNSFY